MARISRVAVLSLCATLCACGASTQAPPPAQPWNDPGFVAAGDWTLYYSAFAARDLTPELAKEYGVAANPSGALVVVSLASADHRPIPQAAIVTIGARTLSGTPRSVRVRRVERDGAVSWLGELDASQREMIVFTASAKPDAQAPAITAEFRRELYLE